eukprot:scaffold968_cov229-Ochromonas_danica.AAC.1
MTFAAEIEICSAVQCSVEYRGLWSLLSVVCVIVTVGGGGGGGGGCGGGDDDDDDDGRCFE